MFFGIRTDIPMENLPSTTTLKQFLINQLTVNKKKLSLWEIDNIFHSVLTAIQCLHQNHTAHNNIHANNIFIRSSDDNGVLQVSVGNSVEAPKNQFLHGEHLKYLNHEDYFCAPECWVESPRYTIVVLLSSNCCYYDQRVTFPL